MSNCYKVTMMFEVTGKKRLSYLTQNVGNLYTIYMRNTCIFFSYNLSSKNNRYSKIFKQEKEKNKDPEESLSKYK